MLLRFTCLLCWTCISTLSASEVDGGTVVPQPNMQEARHSANGWFVLHLAAPESPCTETVHLAPPPGAYIFDRNSEVILRTYADDGSPMSVQWNGDVKNQGSCCLLRMDSDKHVRIEPIIGEPPPSPQNSSGQWFSVSATNGIYAFLGGGNLYGWFAAKRDKNHGAGITHLTHASCPDVPLWQRCSLDFEHIFTGAHADAYRSQFTPRTDPIRFQLLGPGAVRVQWPAESASWNMDCEMQYAFSGDDQLDMHFSVTPREETFALDQIVFMWASYHRHFLESAIFFQTKGADQDQWTRFGPNASSDQKFGGTVAACGGIPLHQESEAASINIDIQPDLCFSTPFYFGLVRGCAFEPTVNEMEYASDSTLLPWKKPGTANHDLMAYMMLFHQKDDLRFAVWNWGTPPETSAWDWQYVLHRPQKDQTHHYHAQLRYSSFQGPEEIENKYLDWSQTNASRLPPQTPPIAQTAFWPQLDHYWGPGNPRSASTEEAMAAAAAAAIGKHDLAAKLYMKTLAGPQDQVENIIGLGEALEQLQKAESAMAQYKDALLLAPENTLAMEKIERLFLEHSGLDDRLDFWNNLCQQHKNAFQPALRLGMAYFDAEDYDHSQTILQKLRQMYPDKAVVLLHQWRLDLRTGQLEKALEQLPGILTQFPDERYFIINALSDQAAKCAVNRQWDHAGHLYQTVMDMEPQDVWHKVRLAEVLEASGKQTSAKPLFKDILSACPEIPYVADRMDHLYQSANEPKQRQLFWEELSRQHPEASLPMLRLGLALFDAEEWLNALTAFEHVLNRQPNHGEALMYTGWIQIKQHHWETGLAKLRLGMSQDASLAPVAVKALLDAVNQAEQSGKFELAVAWLQECIQLAPADLMHHFRLAHLYAAMGNAAAAISEYELILTRDVQATRSAAAMDALLASRNDPDARLTTWRRIVAANPDSGLYQYYLGAVYEDMGDLAAAKSQYMLALTRSPRLESAEAGLQRLEDIPVQ